MPHLPPLHHETSRRDSPNERKIKKNKTKLSRIRIQTSPSQWLIIIKPSNGPLGFSDTFLSWSFLQWPVFGSLSHHRVLLFEICRVCCRKWKQKWSSRFCKEASFVLTSRIKCLYFSSAPCVFVVVCRTRPQNVRWNIWKAMDYFIYLICTWFCSRWLVFSLCFLLLNLVSRTNSSSIAIWSWLR
jgi:hypothetical protein